MDTIETRKPTCGFSLIEVAVALGVIAFTIPALLGMFAIFSDTTGEVQDYVEVAASLGSLQHYLDGMAKEPTSLPGAITQEELDGRVSFERVYSWVYRARIDESSAEVLYAYREAVLPGQYIVSLAAPNQAEVEGKVLAMKIIPAPATVVPHSEITSDVTDYTRAYLPMRVAVHSLSGGAEEPSTLNFVDSYPIAIAR